MPVTFNEKFLAYLALLSGLVISVVAEYYSILGLTAIFSAAAIPVIIMGIALGVGKITATLWLKQNWNIAHWSIKAYLVAAIAVLMLITSMGIFGFLSKAHSEQSLVSGDAQSKIAIYDEKIKTSKENIETNRKALKQMDEAVDQVMGRSTDEKGADKAVALRRAQQKERSRLLSEIEAEQKNVASLSEQRAPIAAEVRKVEAEVGPIKYIAQFVYGETEQSILEKAVTWVIIILIVVFDPLALILLLASQISFQSFRDRERWDFERNLEEAADAFNDVFADELSTTNKTPDELMGLKPDAWVADVGEKPTKEELTDLDPNWPFPTYDEITPKATDPVQFVDFGEHPKDTFEHEKEIAEGDSPEKESSDIVESTATVTTSTVTEIVVEAEVPAEPEPAVREPIRTVITGNRPTQVTKVFRSPKALTTITEEIVQQALEEKVEPTVILDKDTNYVIIDGQRYHRNGVPAVLRTYVQNEEQKESGVWSKVKKDEE